VDDLCALAFLGEKYQHICVNSLVDRDRRMGLGWGAQKTIPIARQHDLRIRAPTRTLIRFRGQFRRAGRIPALEVAANVRGVVDTLDGNVLFADDGFEGVEEGRAGEDADVATLRGAAGEDDGHALAGVRGQVVARDGEVGAFGELVGERGERGKALGLDGGGGGEGEGSEEQREKESDRKHDGGR
jgi:hypothetical protein